MERLWGCLNKKRWTPRIYSRESGYAICALVRMAELASYSAGKYLHVTQIVNGENRPPQYLAKVLQRLSREGILQSRKGPSGGFAFRLAPDKVDLLKIIRAIDGGIPCLERCALGYATCSGEHPCAMHESWKGVRECIRRYVKQTIAELAGTRSLGPVVCGENEPAPPPNRCGGDTVRKWLRLKERRAAGWIPGGIS
jgi:Rrf2 family transcriptional regulator, iron-sulfur cluster assembly transcription factor